LELARIVAAGPPAGSGITIAAWLSWHQYEILRLLPEGSSRNEALENFSSALCVTLNGQLRLRVFQAQFTFGYAEA
jgi:hypothetical protein